jgi:hypothetical protein
MLNLESRKTPKGQTRWANLSGYQQMARIFSMRAFSINHLTSEEKI